MEMLYPSCPDMPEEVCIRCPYWDHLCEVCEIKVLTNSLRCDTISVTSDVKGKGDTIDENEPQAIQFPNSD